MNTKISLIALLIITTTLFFGCTETNPQPEENEEGILSEIDATWIEDTGLSVEEAIATEEDTIAAETEIMGENEEIIIGEMI